MSVVEAREADSTEDDLNLPLTALNGEEEVVDTVLPRARDGPAPSTSPVGELPGCG